MADRGLFVSYRRDDSASATHRLCDHLRINGFAGEDELFLDIDNIPPGADFRVVIEETLERCDVVLVVIGNSWLTLADSKGQRRLDSPSDTHRLEVASALRSDAVVIPVRVEDADQPSVEDLPVDLHDLSYRNAWILSQRRFADDVEGLAEEIREIRSHAESARIASAAEQRRQAESARIAAQQELREQAEAERRLAEAEAEKLAAEADRLEQSRQRERQESAARLRKEEAEAKFYEANTPTTPPEPLRESSPQPPPPVPVPPLQKPLPRDWWRRASSLAFVVPTAVFVVLGIVLSLTYWISGPTEDFSSPGDVGAYWGGTALIVAFSAAVAYVLRRKGH